MDAFQVEAIPGTLVVFRDDCGRAQHWIPGEVHPGDSVPCPDGDHEHYVLDAQPTDLATNIRLS